MANHRRSVEYSRVARALHWSVLLMFTIGLIRQVDELEELDDRAFLIGEFAFATVFLAVLVFRFIYMKGRSIHVSNRVSRKPLAYLERMTHLGMYLSLTTLVSSGLVIGVMHVWFSKATHTLSVVLWLHEASYWTSVNLLVVHILFALYHRHRRDGVWSSMVPWFRE